MQTVIAPIRNLQTGVNSSPIGLISKKGYEYQKRLLITYGQALAERAMFWGVKPDQKITIATTQFDLDNLTKGFIAGLQPTNYALNVMFVQRDKPHIQVTRYEPKGSREILIVLIHSLNETFIVKDIINEAKTYASFQMVYILTPVIVGNANAMLDMTMKKQSESIKLITLYCDKHNGYKNILESQPVYHDGHLKPDKFLLKMLRRTIK